MRYVIKDPLFGAGDQATQRIFDLTDFEGSRRPLKVYRTAIAPVTCLTFFGEFDQGVPALQKGGNGSAEKVKNSCKTLSFKAKNRRFRKLENPLNALIATVPKICFLYFL